MSEVISRTAPSDEIERINLGYLQRDADPAYGTRYTYTNPLNLFSIQQQERALLLALARLGWGDLRDKTILDVGCGTGGMLRKLMLYGAQAKNLAGIDLMPQRIEKARQQLPIEVKLFAQDAQVLTFPDQSFDLVCQYGVFSSILDSRIKRNIAKEMFRCLKQDGVIIWCDMARTPLPIQFYYWAKRQPKRVLRALRNPRLIWRKLRSAPDKSAKTGEDAVPLLAVQNISTSEIEGLFAGCRYDHQSIIPWFETNQPVVNRSWFLAEVLAWIRIFNFWTFSTMRKGT